MKEYRTQDKTQWGHGPWQDEPDKVQFTDAATGLPCLIVRNHSGALCGYVGVLPGHPLHGTDYDDVHVDVHGGLTFAGKCADLSPESWQRRVDGLPSLRSEAEKYPRGDAAEIVRELSPVIDDYEAWRRHAQERAICHVPEPGQSDNVWWLGFDCCHLHDLSPKMSALRNRGVGVHETYRDIAYVREQIVSLARQLADPSAA